jgi:UDP-GlcNAc:undecaprenyl-phosphate GlcNAc-1-phosphate transferase
MIYILSIISAFLLSILSGFFMIPSIMNFCKKKGLYDIPNKRKIHHNLVPRLGGISFLPSMLLAFFVALMALGGQIHGRQITISIWSIGFMVSLLLIYAIGIVDDLIGVGAKIKFIVQIIAAYILTLCGLYINNLYGLFGIHEISYWIGMPLTIFVIVFIVNSINLIDGIDGLAASLSIIALSGFLYCFIREKMTVYCILIAGLIGILIPYLYFNLFGKVENNRKIFMGDSGSLTLGFILGFLFVKYSMDNRNLMPFSNDRIMLGYSLLIIPVFDVVRVIIHRLRNHKSIFVADKNHIHHKLMRAGLTQHQALIVILLLAVFIIILNILIFKHVGITWLVLIDVFIYTLFHILLSRYNYLKIKKKYQQ